MINQAQSIWSRGVIVLPSFLLISSLCWADPIIEGVSGQIKEGRPLTISGRMFGDKPQVAPLIWDDMEEGKFHPDWAETFDLKVSPNAKRHRRSKFNGHLNFTSGATDGRFKMGNDVYRKWFVSYWFQLAKNWNWGSTDYSGAERFLSNIKIFRMWNPGTSNQNFVVAINGWEDSMEYVMEGISSVPRGVTMPGIKEKFSKGTWHLLQFEFADSSQQNRKDGSFRMWFDGRQIVDESNLVTREDIAGFKRPFIIGFSEVWGPNREMGESDRGPNDFYIDDIYVDNSWSRVELGDQPEYASCSHREVQRPTSWKDNSIEVTLNPGSFSDGAPVFLFVVDAKGQVNPSGYPLIIGEGAVEDVKPKRNDSRYKDLRPEEEVLYPKEGQVLKFDPDVFEVKIYDSAGALVFQKTKKNQKELMWDGRNDDGQIVDSDTYLCKIRGIWGDGFFHSLVVK